jgi:alanyl-tRNA synthetase
VDGQPAEEAREGQSVIVVVPETPFYGESGGQVGDRGLILGEGLRIRVQDTRRPQEDVILHLGIVESGTARAGDRVDLVPDPARCRTRRNHSATHLLHRALREVLGAHVRQRGSLVTPDRLRFDFSTAAVFAASPPSCTATTANSASRTLPI